jgi:hypothetical protein
MTPERATSLTAHLELIAARSRLGTALAVINGLSGVVDLFAELLEAHASHVEEVRDELGGHERGKHRITPIIEALRAEALSPQAGEQALEVIDLLQADSPDGVEAYNRLTALLAGNLGEARRTSDPRKRFSLA